VLYFVYKSKCFLSQKTTADMSVSAVVFVSVRDLIKGSSKK